jgi:hypothetical protein
MGVNKVVVVDTSAFNVGVEFLKTLKLSETTQNAALLTPIRINYIILESGCLRPCQLPDNVDPITGYVHRKFHS